MLVLVPSTYSPSVVQSTRFLVEKYLMWIISLGPSQNHVSMLMTINPTIIFVVGHTILDDKLMWILQMYLLIYVWNRLMSFGLYNIPWFVEKQPWLVVDAYLQEVVFENNPSDHETWSIRYHVGIHVDFTSILHSQTPLVPQGQCEANWDWLRFFHQWKCLKCNGHGLSISCVKWP